MFAGFFDFQWLPSFMTNTLFMIVMAVALLALIGVYLVLRNRRPEDD